MEYIYNIFGLVISSEIELPVCNECPTLKDQANVFIRRGDVRNNLPNVKNVMDRHTVVEPNNVWLHIRDAAWVKDAAWIHIKDGRDITVDLYEDADLQTVRLYLLGSGIGAIIHQQGKAIIHGNTIQIGDQSIIFTGDSGAGKSTTSAAFYKKGYSFIADDLAVINSNYEVQPGLPRLKLWGTAAKSLEIGTENLDRIRFFMDKYSCPITKNICTEPKPIKAIFLIETHDANTFEIDELKGIAKLQHIQYHTYRHEYLHMMGYDKQFFKLSSDLAKNITLYKITRPNNSFGFQIDKVVEIIENLVTN